MLMSAAQTSQGARALQYRAAGIRTLACLNTQPNIHARRSYHSSRYRHVESVSRKLLWGSSPRGGKTKASIKKIVASARSSDAYSGNYINVDEVKSWSDEVSGFRPGKNIEDVEQSAIDHLITGNKPKDFEYSLWKSPLRNIRKQLESQRAPTEVTPVDVIHATATSHEESTIDPITNRRVFKKSQTHSSNYKDLDKYGPVMYQEAEKQLADKEKPTDLDKYGPVVDGEKNVQREKQEEYDDLDKYGPVKWNEPDGLQKPTPEEESKKYKDLHKYSSSALDDTFTQRKLTSEEQSKVYEDLDQYNPVFWNEPDGLRQETPEERSKTYDDLKQYGPVRWNEPDGLRKPTSEELSKDYSDLNQYEPVTWSEPDGLRRLTPEEESKIYDDLDAYNTPFVANDSVLQAYEASQQDTTAKAEPLAPKVEVSAEDPAYEYKDLDKYGPVRWNEPDGLRKLTPEELSKKYDDLHFYGATKWNEPDGLRKLTPEEESKQYRDLPEYVPRENEPLLARSHPEEVSKEYEDLTEYRQCDTTDPSNHRIHPEEASKQYNDLHDYSGFESVRERIHPEEASKRYEDVSKYPAASFEEAEKTSQIHPEELSKKYNDLGLYETSGLNNSEAYPVHPEELSKKYSDLGDYKNGSVFTAFASAAGNGPKDDSSKAGSQQVQDGSLCTHRPRDNRSSLGSTNIKSMDSSSGRGVLTPQDSKDWHDSSWDATTQEALRDIRKYRAPKLSQSFDYTLSPDKVSSDVQSEIQDVDELCSMDESFPIEGSRPQTVLKNSWTRGHTEEESWSDPYSKVPQGLETCYAEECAGQTTWPALVKHYAAKETQPEGTTATDDKVTHEKSYKVLAYDPDTQTVNVAETTSTVHNDALPSAPADILLKLSHPSKFLPYFSSLEMQGYEMLTGSGDILVFRKTRPASTTMAPQSPQMGPTRINPIDMMGKPLSGNFASPTGFVNYEILADEHISKPAPPFRSSSYDEHQESGLKSSNSMKQRKTKSLGKKMVMGTVGIAGSAYALGVVGEYFNTGGEDGAGPKRL